VEHVEVKDTMEVIKDKIGVVTKCKFEGKGLTAQDLQPLKKDDD